MFQAYENLSQSLRDMRGLDIMDKQTVLSFLFCVALARVGFGIYLELDKVEGFYAVLCALGVILAVPFVFYLYRPIRWVGRTAKVLGVLAMITAISDAVLVVPIYLSEFELDLDSTIKNGAFAGLLGLFGAIYLYIALGKVPTEEDALKARQAAKSEGEAPPDGNQPY